MAGEEELALLREKLWTPPQPPPRPQDFESIRADLIERIQEPVNRIWPAQNALEIPALRLVLENEPPPRNNIRPKQSR